MKLKILVILAALIASACATKDQLSKTLEENPEILTNAIKKNPKVILTALNEAVELAKNEERQNQTQQAEKQIDEEFKNPKEPLIEDNRVIFGNKDAKVTVVEYSDFECPYCKRGYQVVQQIKDAYGDKVRIVYKHLPLSFHPQAEPAARFFEAIALQSHKKAEKFHDLVFENQSGLSGGEKFLKKMAKKAGANVNKVMKDLNSDKVTKRLKADQAEAAQFEFTGTPGFLVNGVSVKGAYPFPHFKKLIDRHLGVEKSEDKDKDKDKDKS